MIPGNDPIPLRFPHGGPGARAGRCLDRVSFCEQWPLEQRTAVFWKICSQTAAPARRGSPARLAGLGAAVAALALLAFVSLRSPAPEPFAVQATSSGSSEAPAWSQLNLAEVGMLEVSSSLDLDLRDTGSEIQLHFARGTLRAQVVRQDPLRPVVVVTPHARVVVVGTRFDVDAEPSRTRVRVLEGLVWVQAYGRSVPLRAGGELDSTELQPVPAEPRAPVPAAPRRAARPGRAEAGPAAASASRSCGRLPSSQQKACLLDRASGTGLGAQNALLALGFFARDVEDEPDRALDYFRRYASLFPDGPLAPEAALAAFETLKAQRRSAEAIAAAAAFEQRFADDPRAGEVALVRADLLCGQPGRGGEAKALLQRLAFSPDEAFRERVARAAARCDAARAAEPAEPEWWVRPPWNRPNETEAAGP